MASWARITRNWDWTAPNGRAMKAYPPGDHYLTDSQLERLEADGAGERLAERPAGKRAGKDGQTHAD